MPVQFWAIFDEFTRVSSIEPDLLKATKPSTNRCEFGIFSGNCRIIFALSGLYTNTSLGCELHVTEWDSEWWGWQFTEPGRPYERTVFSLDQNSTGTVGWRGRKGDGPAFVSSVDLATWALKRLISRVELQRMIDRERRDLR